MSALREIDLQGILTESDPRLRLVSEPITDWSVVPALAEKLIRTMVRANGIGIAAIQIGVPLRMIVVTIDDDPAVMINPRLVRSLRREAVELEGCLSIPRGRWQRIARPAKCDVEWQDLAGASQTATLSKIEARCVMHEIEHLDGLLLTDRAAA